MTEWASTSAAGTYPTSMVFHTFADRMEFGNADQSPNGDWTLAYNLSSGAQTRITGLSTSGFRFDQSSSAQTGAGFIQNMGAAVLALNTIGRSNIQVTWTAQSSGTLQRPYVVRLQARIGSSGSWQNVVRGDGSFVEHDAVGSGTSVQTYTHTLPAAVDNKSLVQVRWLYFQNGDGSGSRPSVRVDDIAVSSTTFTSAPVVSAAYVTTTGSLLVGYAGIPLPAFTVRVFNSLNNLETGYNSTLSVTRVSGPSFPTGTTSVQAFGGVAEFNNVIFASAGTYNIRVNVPNGTAQTLMTVQVLPTPTITANIVPQYIYGFTSSNSAYNTPAYAHITMSNLTPNMKYRYVVGGSNTVDPNPASAGAGTNIHYDHTTDTYNFVSGKSTSVDGNHSVLVTGATETSKSFFINLVPSNNATFTNGNTVYWQVELADASGRMIRRYQLSATSKAMSTDATGTGATLMGDMGSQLGEKNFVLLYDNVDGTGQPVGIGMVQSYNTTVGFTTNRYRFDIENKQGAWMTQIPNAVASGAPPCEFTFDLTDSFGDGWNGARMTVTDLSSNATVATIGTAFTTGRTFSEFYTLTPGRNYKLTWTTGGSWSSEVGITVRDYAGNAIFTMPSGSSSRVGSDLTSFGCAPVPSTGVFRIVERTLSGAVVSTMTSDNGIWNGVNSDPFSYGTPGGFTTPIYINTPSVKVLSPAAGDTLCAGTVTTVRWRADGMTNVKVEYSIDGGANYSTAISSYPASAGQLDWAVPSGGLLGNCRVRVTGVDRPEVGTSGSFAIVEPVAMVQPLNSKNLCLGSNDTLVAFVSGTIRSYQWYKDGDAIPMANQPVLELKSVQFNTSGVYWCEVSGFGPCGDVVTNEAHIRVGRATSITNQTYAVPGIMGETVEMMVEAEFPNEVLGYAWYRGDQMLENGDKFTGVNSNVLRIHNFDSDDYSNEYHCVVSGVCGTATSRKIRVFSSGVFVEFMQEEYSLCGNGSLTINGMAYSNPAGETLDLQWFRNGVALSNGTSSTGSSISGANSTMLTITNATAADAGTYMLMASLDLNPAIFGEASTTVTVGTTPSITAQPAAAEVCAGEAVSMTVAADAQGTVMYQWYQDGTAIPGATEATLEVAAATAARAGEYTVEVSTACGTVTSDAATLTVKAATEITTQPAATVDLKVAETLTLTVDATGSGTVQYQWIKDGVDLAGEVAATYTKMNVVADDAGSYTCRVTAECGEVVSDAAVVTVAPVVSVDEDVVAGGVIIDRVTPNPVAGQANVSVTLPRMMNVTMLLVDASGSVVATITNGTMAQGTHVLPVNGASVASGIYALQTIVDGARHLQTVVIVK
ncbi:MAG: immunoglobulin domain-containing protein [Candidatus Kapaibacteriota bacterium]